MLKNMLQRGTDIIKRRVGPLWKDSQYRDVKDPCPVFDGKYWHIFGSGGSVNGERQEEWEILHAIAPSLEGPWTELPSVKLLGLGGKHIAAPGVLYEKGLFHMYVQTEFLDLGGTIEYLTSRDGGHTFTRQSTTLHSIPDTHEAALYDPHPCIISGEKYITYSGSNFIGKGAISSGGEWVGQPDIYLLKSQTNTWAGPWKRCGKILDHSQVIHHNQRDQMSYEWGLEGSQLIELPNGIIIMNVVCFLPYGEFSTRQRVFFAFASKITGPYYTAGTVLDPVEDSWENGENGHAAAFMRGREMILFYQARPPHQEPWRYGIAHFSVRTLERIGKSTLQYHRALAKVTKQREKNELTALADRFADSRYVVSLTDFTREVRVTFRRYRSRLKIGQLMRSYSLQRPETPETQLEN